MKYQKDNYFHLYNRGVNKGKIFFNDDNYIYLLKKMKKSYKQYGVNVISYCLMPNHYHIFVKQLTELPVSKWIQNLFNGYVQAVNLQQNRTGSLFEGKLQSRLVDDEKYLVHISRYIHLNPLKAELVKNLDDWPYCNYHEWVGIRNGELFDKEFFDTYFNNFDDYKMFLNECIDDFKIGKYTID